MIKNITKITDVSLINIGVFNLFLIKDLNANDRPGSVINNVPFAMQAPFGNWLDPRQADGCEESALIMAMRWIRGSTPSKEEIERDIINISEYERVIFGFYQDTWI